MNCSVRAVSRSSDGGETWSPLLFDTNLPDSVCEASLNTVGNGTLVFFNPAMRHARNQPTLRFSADGGKTWPTSVLVADSFADYSAIVNGPLLRGGGQGESDDTEAPSRVGGLLWGGCEYPVPFRVWCLPVNPPKTTFWTVSFTRFDIPPPVPDEGE